MKRDDYRRRRDRNRPKGPDERSRPCRVGGHSRCTGTAVVGDRLVACSCQCHRETADRRRAA